MAFELTKSEKKLARQLIEKGLQVEYTKGIEQQSQIVEQWRLGNTDTKDSYLKLYQSVTSYDKHIAERYDDMRGSKYLFIIAGQLADEIITLDEIENFSEETKSFLLRLSRINEDA